MKTPDKSPEKGAKVGGSAKRNSPVVESVEEADASAPMENFKSVTRRVLQVSNKEVIKAEHAERRKRQKD